MNIDNTKKIYLFTHGRTDVRQSALDALESCGYDISQVVDAVPDEVGEVGDYMAMLWMPPNPDHIKIQVITKVEPAKPDGMIGLWKGVDKDNLDIVYL